MQEHSWGGGWFGASGGGCLRYTYCTPMYAGHVRYAWLKLRVHKTIVHTYPPDHINVAILTILYQSGDVVRRRGFRHHLLPSQPAHLQTKNRQVLVAQIGRKKKSHSGGAISRKEARCRTYKNISSTI